MRAIWMLSIVLSLISSGCSKPEIRHEDTADHICRPHDANCVPVTPGFIEERIYNLVEIHRLKKELEACQAQHSAFTGSIVVVPANFSQATFKCTVHGTLYVNEGAGHLTGREDGCQMLDVAMTDEGIRVKHKSIRVYIPVPMSGGHMQFHYRWGSTVATVGGHERPVHVERD